MPSIGIVLLKILWHYFNKFKKQSQLLKKILISTDSKPNHWNYVWYSLIRGGSSHDYHRPSGSFVSQPGDYSFFHPKPLPPTPSVRIDNQLMSLLSRADRVLGRLDGIAQTLPNPDLFVAMYVKKEAVLSSQIEGTQASLIDLLEADGGDHLVSFTPSRFHLRRLFA